MESLYIVTAIHGSSVINTFYDDFLIVVYASAVEYYKVSNGLELESRIPLNAKVSCAAFFESQLLILTEKCQLIVFKSNKTLHSLELREESGRMAEYGHIMITDPTNNYIVCYMYQGLCKVIPVESITGEEDRSDTKKGKRKVTLHRSPFNVRLKELLIIDMVFLYTVGLPCLVILHQDSLENLHVVSYTIDFENKTLVKSDLIQECTVEQGTNKLIPLMGNMKGKVVAIGQVGFTLLSKSNPQTVYNNSDGKIISAWEWMDNSTLLTVDHNGSLDQLKVLEVKDELWGLKSCGIVSQATSLTKISNNLMFVGSHYTDSQLLNIQNQAVTVIDSITNLAPIIDFCLVDFEKRGQSQVVACCGAHKDGSLRIIRNGIGIEEIGELGDMNGITGLFALRQIYDSKLDSILAISFVAETRFQIMNEGVLEELEDTNGLVTTETTLLCANVKPDSIVQVQNEYLTDKITPSFVYLLGQTALNLYASWSPPNNTKIVTASVNDSQILLGISGGSIVYLEIIDGELSPISVKNLKNEISSVNIFKMDGTKSNYCAVGTWTDVAVRILRLSSLDEVECKKTPGDVVARSILISQLSNNAYLFIGLGDGTLVIYSFDKETGSLTEPKKYTIGTQQIRLIHFCSNEMDCVLACSDHPSVIHNEGGKLRFANVNIKDLNYLVPFNTEFTPHALSYVTDETLKVGLIEQIQRIHIKTIPMGETVRKIVHQTDMHVFGLLTTAIISANLESSNFKILDEHTYELLDTYTMEEHEIVQSLVSLTIDYDGAQCSYFIVGTAFVLPTEEEPNQGRLLVFEVNKFRKLVLCYEIETKGCVYSLSLYEKNMIVASINSGVFLYRFVKENDQISLQYLCSYHGYIVAVSVAICGAFIIVGDLMKSVSVLTYDPTENKLNEAYRDYATNYMTCVEAIDEDIFLGADNASNVFTLKRSENDANDNHQLEENGQYHLGDMINQFRHGSLVLPMSETERMIEPKIIYGTLNGSLGVIAKISKSLSKLLYKMEKSMTTHVKAAGSLDHDKWRTFLSERGHFILDNRQFIDGDLIESYIDLEAPIKEAIYEDLKDEIDSMDSLIKLIEEISRSH